MGSEFIKLPDTQVNYGKKTLLQAQLNLLTSINRIKKYHQLRKQEQALKLKLKNKIQETLSTLSDLDTKYLPESDIKAKAPKSPGRPKSGPKKDKETLNLEILDIKRKLERLQNS